MSYRAHPWAEHPATWAATEVKVSSKYDLRYVSEGVFRACERLGDLRTWVGRRDGERLIHEHVNTRKHLRAMLYAAASHNDVLQALSAAEGCVVTFEEHLSLSRSRESGWARYADAGVAVYDRLLQEWRGDCGIPTL
jgi:hypothetical protein